MNFTAAVIAEFLKGSVEGDPNASVSDISKIEEGNPERYLSLPIRNTKSTSTKPSLPL